MPLHRVGKIESNFIYYDTETCMLGGRLAIARFNASKHVRGASVGEPPDADAFGGEPVKFDLASRSYVKRSAPAATYKRLKNSVEYRGPPAFAHWK